MIRVRTMTLADLGLGMRLKEQAGWNQTGADWRRFLAMEPKGCFVAEFENVPAGTTTTCVFGTVAWIAMVLVDERMRGRGIGKALMTHALRYLDAAGARSIRLDATLLGQPVYEKLGFCPQFELVRYMGLLPMRGRVPSIRRAKPADWSELLRLDRKATGTGRAKLLKRLFAEYPNDVWLSELTGYAAGYYAVRRGSQALQLGPVIGGYEGGRELLNHACHVYKGEYVYIDIPRHNKEPQDMALAWGLTEQRSLLRMCRGPDVREDVRRLWTSSGPEKG
jgi:GNAT superfamily N-acetyltransferase